MEQIEPIELAGQPPVALARNLLMDSDVGQSRKDDPAKVAQDGFDAMMEEESDVVSGWKNKMQSALANITPSSLLAQQHRKMAEPGSAKG